MIYDEIKHKWIAARKEKNTLMVGLYSTLKSEIDNIAKSDGQRAVTEADCITIIKKFVKNATITRDHKHASGQEPIGEIREINALEDLLPTQMSRNEIRVTVENIITQNKFSKNMQYMGKVMGQLKAECGGQYDGKLASQVVKECLL